MNQAEKLSEKTNARAVFVSRCVGIFSQVYHIRNARVLLAKAAETRTMIDAIYLLMLAGLYAVTHGLVLALDRLGKTS